MLRLFVILLVVGAWTLIECAGVTEDSVSSVLFKAGGSHAYILHMKMQHATLEAAQNCMLRTTVQRSAVQYIAVQYSTV